MNEWSTFNANSLLGASLLGQKKNAEAEPLLLAGYEGMMRSEDKIPQKVRKSRLADAVERLVRLYEAMGDTDRAAEWRQKLAMTQTDPQRP